MNPSDYRLPSKRLQLAVAVFEEDFRQKAPKDQPFPEWSIMASALYSAFNVFDKAEKLGFMFDTSNPFDRAMLVWCVEVDRREKEKKPQPPTIDLSRN